MEDTVYVLKEVICYKIW